MAKELPNFDISAFDFIWNDTTVDRQIMFYKNAFKIKEKTKSTTEIKRRRPEIPVWEKSSLTIDEAAAYSGIGINKLRELTNQRGCNFVLFVGTKRLIKRRLLDAYIEKTDAV